MRTRALLIPTVLCCFALGPAALAAAQPPQPGPPGRQLTPGAQNARSNPPEDEGVEPVEKVSTTQHTATIAGKTIPYTANASTMIIRDDAGKPKATVFYTSHTADKAEPTNRPVTFFFNGGPGSASSRPDMG